MSMFPKDYPNATVGDVKSALDRFFFERTHEGYVLNNLSEIAMHLDGRDDENFNHSDDTLWKTVCRDVYKQDSTWKTWILMAMDHSHMNPRDPKCKCYACCRFRERAKLTC